MADYIASYYSSGCPCEARVRVMREYACCRAPASQGHGCCTAPRFHDLTNSSPMVSTGMENAECAARPPGRRAVVPDEVTHSAIHRIGGGGGGGTPNGYCISADGAVEVAAGSTFCCTERPHPRTAALICKRGHETKKITKKNVRHHHEKRGWMCGSCVGVEPFVYVAFCN